MAVNEDIRLAKKREAYLRDKDRYNAKRRLKRADLDPETKKLQGKELYLARKSRGNSGNKKWRATPAAKDYIQKYRIRWLEQNPGRERANKLAKFGLTPERYDAILKAQHGKCAICRKTETAWDSRQQRLRRLSVDHHHGSGAARGLLCSNCNNGLGRFNDDPKLLLAALKYLESFGFFVASLPTPPAAP